MTDTIGTADIDRPTRSRVPSLPRWLLWSAAAVVLLIAVVVPYARDRLADSSARWLRNQWTLRAAYDDARAAVIQDVNKRAGVLDDPAVIAAAAIADREESAVLVRMARALVQRGTWAGDVARSRAAMLTALRAEIAALNHDAVDQPTTGYLFAPDVDRLVAAASGRIASMARRYHLGRPQVPRATLPPARSVLDRLRKPTDFPTGLSLVIDSARGPRIVDLDTGHQVDLPMPRGETEVHFWSGQVIVVSEHGVRAFDASGRLTARFGSTFAELLSSGGTSVWLSGPRGVRQFASDGHPLTPWVPRPPHRSAAAATGNVIVLNHVQQELTLVSELWRPATGTLRLLPRNCFGGWAAAGRTVVSLPCGGEREIAVIDAVTGAARQVSVPGRVADGAVEVLDPLSPAGDQLAVSLEGPGPRPGLLDLRTGRFRLAPGDGTLTPAAWSTDERWVLLADEQSIGNGRRPRVALWDPRDGRTTSVRLPAGSDVQGDTQLLSADSP